MSQESTIMFPNGILGFEELRAFTIIQKQKDQATVYWLQSEENPLIAFPLVDPANYGLTFSFDLTDAEQALLQSNSPEEIEVFLILAKDTEAKQGIQANIGGPIVINKVKRLGMQKVLYQVNFTGKIEGK
jgi:flagellar assembly factor FliW